MLMPPKKKSGLGRGLDAILSENSTPETAAVVAAATSINEIALSQIERNPFQPRTEFEETTLQELAASIRVHGVIQPVTVRRMGEDKFQLISGERRLRAAEIAGLAGVPAYIRTANDEQMIEMALIENIQREDLNPIEVAFSYRRMIDELNLRQEDLGEKVGKKRETVSNFLRLLKLTPEVQKALKERTLSMGHAKTLITIEDPTKQVALFKQIVQNDLSVRQAEELRRKLDEEKKNPKPAAKEDGYAGIHLREVQNQLERKFGTKVILKQQSNGKGELLLPFMSTDDLNRLLEILEIA